MCENMLLFVPKNFKNVWILGLFPWSKDDMIITTPIKKKMHKCDPVFDVLWYTHCLAKKKSPPGFN